VTRGRSVLISSHAPIVPSLARGAAWRALEAGDHAAVLSTGRLTNANSPCKSTAAAM
jgi:hypothetical protein